MDEHNKKQRFFLRSIINCCRSQAFYMRSTQPFPNKDRTKRNAFYFDALTFTYGLFQLQYLLLLVVFPLFVVFAYLQWYFLLFFFFVAIKAYGSCAIGSKFIEKIACVATKNVWTDSLKWPFMAWFDWMEIY